MHDQLLSLQTSLLDWAEPDARPFFQNWRCALMAWDEWQSRCHRSRAEIRLNLNLHLYAIWVFFWVLMQQHFTIPARLGSQQGQKDIYKHRQPDDAERDVQG